MDPRDVVDTQVGTRLRDAAANPKAGDFLEPTNAGAAGQLGNPHGPNVVSPEIHGSEGVRPIRPGPVSSTPATQDAAEKAHLAVSLADSVNSLSVTPATATLAAAGTQQLVATATLMDGVTTAVVTGGTVWSSSAPSKATVSVAGLVTAVATGSATITGSYEGKTDTCVVTVS